MSCSRGGSDPSDPSPGHAPDRVLIMLAESDSATEAQNQ